MPTAFDTRRALIADTSPRHMVWIAGELVYGTAMVVQSVRSTGCEEVIVQGARSACARRS